MKRDFPNPTARKVAFDEASRRIDHALRSESLEIGFQDLEDLTELPAQISELKNLKRLSLQYTSISDISAIENLTSLRSLDIDDTLVISLSPISKLPLLSTLYASDTLIDDISPISNLNLYALSIENTRVRDLSPISKMENLSRLDIENTPVSDLGAISDLRNLRTLNISKTRISSISPISRYENLTDLDISKTDIADLSPISGMKSLFRPFRTGGVNFTECHKLPKEIQHLSRLQNPGRTIKLDAYLNGQHQSSDKRELVDTIETTSLHQRPAPYSFTWKGDEIRAVPHRQDPFDSRLATDIADVVKEKICLALSKLQGNMADSALTSALESALLEVSRPINEIRDGILLMRLRSVQAVSAAYFDAGSGHEGSARASVIDVAFSLEDLLALFPGARTIDANRQALNFQSDNKSIDRYSGIAENIFDIARRSDVVSREALRAAQDGSSEIKILGDLIATSSNEIAIAAAIEKRASLASLQILGIRNFVVAPMRRAYEELSPVAGESWKQIKIAIPAGIGAGVQGVVSGSIKSAAALFVASLAGPIAGLAVLIGSFGPLAKAADQLRQEAESEESEDEGAS